MNRKRTIVYIDGSNLYYGLLRDSTDKWLDLMLFVKSLLRDDHEIAMIKYFASRVIDKSSDHHRSARQDKYFDALRNRSCIEVIEGYYREKKERMEASDQVCRECLQSPRPGYVRGFRTTEKLTDVNIATEMLKDAYEQRAEAYVLISGDSDLSRAVRIVRYSVKKPILVFNPQRGICNELRKYSTLYRNLEIGSTAGCRLPDSFATADGRMIHCPEAWRA